PMQVGDGRIYTFSLARFYAGTQSRIWTNAPPGFYYPGDPGFNGKAGINGSWKNFEPRVGIAFDPFGEARLRSAWAPESITTSSICSRIRTKITSRRSP